jgi:hypothetical protein
LRDSGVIASPVVIKVSRIMRTASVLASIDFTMAERISVIPAVAIHARITPHKNQLHYKADNCATASTTIDIEAATLGASANSGPGVSTFFTCVVDRITMDYSADGRVSKGVSIGVDHKHNRNSEPTQQQENSHSVDHCCHARRTSWIHPDPRNFWTSTK